MKVEKDFDEAIDRLICANFNFKYNKEDHSISFTSYPGYEKTSDLIGFHYWGRAEEYIYYLDTWTLEEFIGSVFDRYKELINQGIKRRIQQFGEGIDL